MTENNLNASLTYYLMAFRLEYLSFHNEVEAFAGVSFRLLPRSLVNQQNSEIICKKKKEFVTIIISIFDFCEKGEKICFQHDRVT